MQMGIAGGLLFGGLITGAVLGVVPGLVLSCLGAVVSCCMIISEHRKEQQAASWRRNYPKYKY